MADDTRETCPVHKWTDDDGWVLLVKCVNAAMTSYGGFQWPTSGIVKPETWDPRPVCGGGLHAWPWGLGIGDGSELKPLWLVLRARPENIVGSIEGGLKCKASEVEVVYCGDMAEAMRLTMAGRVGWVQHNSEGSSSATGYGGSSSATGYGGSSSATGKGGFAFSEYRAMAGEDGALVIRWWDTNSQRYRFAFGAVGEDGIEAGVWYVVRDGRLTPEVIA